MPQLLPAFEIEFKDGTKGFCSPTELIESNPRVIADYFIKEYM